jgi:hypothetical protein
MRDVNFYTFNFWNYQFLNKMMYTKHGCMTLNKIRLLVQTFFIFIYKFRPWFITYFYIHLCHNNFFSISFIPPSWIWMFVTCFVRVFLCEFLCVSNILILYINHLLWKKSICTRFFFFKHNPFRYTMYNKIYILKTFYK